MASSLFLGTQSRDLPTIGNAGVTPSPINIAGLLIDAERGTDTVHELFGTEQIAEIFGRFRTGYYGHYGMVGFFQNLQGEDGTLYVKRMVPSDAVASTVSVNNGAANPSWQMQAGRRGLTDPGVWGNQLWALIIASSRGGSALSVALTGNETQVEVDAVSDFKVGDWIDIDDTTNNHQARITAIDETDSTLTFTPANPAANAIAISAPVTVVDRTLKVYLKDSDTGNVELVEQWDNLTVASQSLEHYWESVLNDEFTGSKYLKGTQLVTAEADTFDDFPVAVADDFANAVQLTTGANGTALTTTQMAAQLVSFDPYPIRYLSNTEAFSEAVWDDGELYCKVRGDTVWVGCPTMNLTFEQHRDWARRRRRTRKMYAINNGIWLNVDDPIGVGPLPLKSVPNVGHIMGYIIYLTTVRGVHKVPADRKQTMVGVRSLVGELIEKRETRDLANIGLNIISDINGAFAIRSARTPSKAAEWAFINAVIMSVYFKKSFEESFVDLENEPNTVTLLTRIRESMFRFALTFSQSSSNGGSEGGFASFLKPDGGESQFADVVKIVVDETINPKADLNQGILKANFYFMPPPPAERILIGVGLIFNQ